MINCELPSLKILLRSQFCECTVVGATCTFFHASIKSYFYNIARVLALYNSYWAAMNKIFIYACPYVNKDFFSGRVQLCFSSLFLGTQKSTGNDEKFYIFLEFSFVLATQTNRKSGKDVSPIIEPKWFVEKDLKTGKTSKRPQIGLCWKISSLYKLSSVFNVYRQ